MESLSFFVLANPFRYLVRVPCFRIRGTARLSTPDVFQPFLYYIICTISWSIPIFWIFLNLFKSFYFLFPIWFYYSMAKHGSKEAISFYLQFAVLCRLIPRGAILIRWDFQLQSLVFLNFSGSLLEYFRAKFTPSKLACEVFHKGRRKWSRWVFMHKIVSQSLLRWFSLSFRSHLLQTAPLIPPDPLFLIFIFWYILLVSCI